MFTSSFFPLITKPTRITQHTSTLIDNIFTNDLDQVQSSSNGLIFTDISDHLPIFHIASVSLKKCKSNMKISQRKNINNCNLLSFSNTVKDISWDFILEDSDACQSYNNFHSKLFQAFDNKSFPFEKSLGKVNINYDKSPWMTQGISKSVEIKNRLYKRFLKNRNERNYNIYKKYKNKLNHLIKIAKKDYFENQFIKYKNNVKMTWQTINQVLQRIKSKGRLPDTFREKNKDVSFSDPVVITNRFNEYFVSVGPNLAKKSPKDDTTTFKKYLKGNYKESMFAEPITEYEIITEIDQLKSNKGAGHDEFNAKLIQTIKPEISKPLTHIFNLTFQSGLIPDSLKIALVTPIYKANENFLFENYRPISVLTCFSKLLERLMYKRLISFINKQRILSKHQFGFRKNHSTDHAIIELSDNITKAMDEDKYTIGIFLDLSKAFDTVNHQILLNKLEHYGIRGLCLKWFESDLHGRTQIVKFGDHRSNKMSLTTGVPQGSILGPLLFLLYINDIENSSDILSLVLYADDTNAFHSDKCLQTLANTMQDEMNKVTEWLNANKLSINTSKTKFIIFESKTKKYGTKINLKINNNIIQQAAFVKFLGVIIDEKLTWKNHISFVHKKTIEAAALIAKLRHYTNKNTLKLIYYALVYPYLTHGNLIWGNTYQTKLQKILNVQKKIVRLISFKSYLEHSNPLFHNLKMLNIFKINDYLCSLFMYRYKYFNNLPVFFNDYTLHRIMKYVIIILEMQTNCMFDTGERTTQKQTISNKGVITWNILLDNELANITSYSTFKKSKIFFLEYN